MTHDEFVAMLDKTNPRYESLRKLIVNVPDSWCFARKGRDLVEVVEQFRADGRAPVIDKKLRVVIGSFAHRAIRAELYRYHNAMTGIKEWPSCIEEDSAFADAYSREGMGYHFSSMDGWQMLIYKRDRPHPHVGDNYRPDRFDKDLFLLYEVNTS